MITLRFARESDFWRFVKNPGSDLVLALEKILRRQGWPGRKLPREIARILNVRPLTVRKITDHQFSLMHAEAYEDESWCEFVPDLSQNAGTPTWGEINFAGFWCPAVIYDGKPVFFWDEDGSWQWCPPGAVFEEAP